jgi:hypothetical protein
MRGRSQTFESLRKQFFVSTAPGFIPAPYSQYFICLENATYQTILVSKVMLFGVAKNLQLPPAFPKVVPEVFRESEHLEDLADQPAF